MRPYILGVFRFLIGTLLVFSVAPSVWAQLKINIIAVNPSEREAKEIDLKFPLPKELAPDNILDAGGLDLDYDVKKGRYVVKGKVKFNPKESKTFKVEVEDVWRIKEEEIGFLKKQLDENLRLLEKNEIYPVAKKAHDEMYRRLDFILSQQENYSDDVNKRIEQYRAYVEELEQIRNNAYDLNYLQLESKALEESKNIEKTVRLVVEVRNPSDKREQEVTLKHYLPEEIREEHILDKKDFEVRFDGEKGLTYLTKDEKFKPAEVKKYEFLLKDVWHFPLVRLDTIKNQADTIMKELEGSGFYESGKFLYDAIVDRLDKIRKSQEEELPIEQHIGRFRVNEKRYKEAQDDLKRLDQMLAVVRAKRLEELEGSRVKNVLQKLKALRGLAALSEALFKKGISVTATWRIIFGTIIFVAFFTTLHFFIWSKRSGKMGEELASPDGVKAVPPPGAGDDSDEE